MNSLLNYSDLELKALAYDQIKLYKQIEVNIRNIEAELIRRVNESNKKENESKTLTRSDQETSN